MWATFTLNEDCLIVFSTIRAAAFPEGRFFCLGGFGPCLGFTEREVRHGDFDWKINAGPRALVDCSIPKSNL